MQELTGKTNKTKWLISNLNVDGKSIGGLDKWCVREVPLANSPEMLRIGLFGLAGPDWLDQLCPIITEEIEYEDFVKKGQQMTDMLREQESCQLIIALTHMRAPMDRILAN